MLKIWISFLIMMIFSVTALADTGVIKISGDNDYKAVRITPEIYSRANPDLSDILIFDEGGNAVPYFINSVEATATEAEYKTYPLMLLDSYIKDGDSYSDYYTEAVPDTDIVATGIAVDTASVTFAKNIELRGSYDGVNWEFIQNDKLYLVDGNEKLSISFKNPLKYTHYRFRIIDNAEKITFDGVSLLYSRTTISREFFTEDLKPLFNAEQNERYTLIKLYGLKNLKLKDITLHTDSLFKRTVFFEGGRSKELYNLSFGNASYNDTTISLDGLVTYGGEAELSIDNGDDAPIEIKDIDVSYYADEIVFKGQAGESYKISFGMNSEARAPVYDIAGYKELILKEDVDVLDIESIEEEEAPEERPKPDYTVAFNIVVVIISILLAGIILMRLKIRR